MYELRGQEREEEGPKGQDVESEQIVGKCERNRGQESGRESLTELAKSVRISPAAANQTRIQMR